MPVMFTSAAPPSSSSTLSATGVARRGVLPVRASYKRGSPRRGGAWGARGLDTRVCYCWSLGCAADVLQHFQAWASDFIMDIAGAHSSTADAHTRLAAQICEFERLVRMGGLNVAELRMGQGKGVFCGARGGRGGDE